MGDERDGRAVGGATMSDLARRSPGEVSVADFLQAVMTLKELGVIGGRPAENTVDEPRQSLQELRDELAEMYADDALWAAEEAAAEKSASPDT